MDLCKESLEPSQRLPLFQHENRLFTFISQSSSEFFKSFNPPNNPARNILLLSLSLCYKWGNWGGEGLCEVSGTVGLTQQSNSSTLDLDSDPALPLGLESWGQAYSQDIRSKNLGNWQGLGDDPGDEYQGPLPPLSLPTQNPGLSMDQLSFVSVAAMVK